MNKLEKSWVEDFLINSIWENSNHFKVKILDFGETDVWLYYFENGNKVGLEVKKFLETYKPCLVA